MDLPAAGILTGFLLMFHHSQTSMTLTTRKKRKLKTVLSITAITVVFGSLYPCIFVTPHQATAPQWHSILNGFLVGFFVGIVVSLGEIFLFQTRLRSLRFSAFLAVQTLYYHASIFSFAILVVSSHYVIFHGYTFAESLHSADFNSFYRTEFLKVNIYALLVLFMLNFFRQVNRMLGQNVLLDFFTGKYHTPVEEDRVFMFLDLNASTAIAEKLGHKRFHQFLDDFFFDITPAILESRGEVYQYVGDEVVVTWTKEKGLRNANCINCYFLILAAIAEVDKNYDRKYSFVPRFKAGYHYGTVTVGLSGDIKRGIVFHGDTVNTAARIRSECTEVHRPLLVSGDLLKELSATPRLTSERIGNIRLRGKEEEVELYAIQEAA
jgi:adenylate cyclase